MASVQSTWRPCDWAVPSKPFSLLQLFQRFHHCKVAPTCRFYRPRRPRSPRARFSVSAFSTGGSRRFERRVAWASTTSTVQPRPSRRARLRSPQLPHGAAAPVVSDAEVVAANVAPVADEMGVPGR
eukprot:4117457-Prymnesium_polylepis.1